MFLFDSSLPYQYGNLKVNYVAVLVGVGGVTVCLFHDVVGDNTNYVILKNRKLNKYCVHGRKSGSPG